MKYSSHNTYHNAEGTEVPSVTTVLKILNKPHLAKWANIMGFKRKKIDDILEESSLIGTVVHEGIECFIMKKEFTYFKGRQNGKTLFMKYMDGFITWFKNNKLEPEFMEESHTTTEFGGTIDYYGKINDKYTVLDFKTSKKFYPTMFLQLGAYTHILEEKGKQVDQVIILRVNQDKCVEKTMTREEIEPYRIAFLNLVKVFHLLHAMYEKDKWGDLT